MNVFCGGGFFLVYAVVLVVVGGVLVVWVRIIGGLVC